jgi:hypothetical protein
MLVFRAGNRDFQGGVARPPVVARLSFAHTDRRRAARRGKLGRRPHHPLWYVGTLAPDQRTPPWDRSPISSFATCSGETTAFTTVIMLRSTFSVLCGKRQSLAGEMSVFRPGKTLPKNHERSSRWFAELLQRFPSRSAMREGLGRCPRFHSPAQ